MIDNTIAKRKSTKEQTLKTEGDYGCSGQIVSYSRGTFFDTLLDQFIAWLQGSDNRQYIIVEGEYKNKKSETNIRF